MDTEKMVNLRIAPATDTLTVITVARRLDRRIDRLGLAISLLAMLLFVLAVAWAVGHRAGERERGSEHAAEIASLQTAVAAMSDRLAEFTEAYTTTGLASFYSHTFHGRPTASREIFDKDKLTAASRWLPLKTWWTVTRLDTGKSVRVWLNDRGPYVGNRIIDLSEAAAKKLGMTDTGIVRVKIEPSI